MMGLSGWNPSIHQERSVQAKQLSLSTLVKDWKFSPWKYWTTQFIILEMLSVIEGGGNYFHPENIKIYMLNYGLQFPSNAKSQAYNLSRGLKDSVPLPTFLPKRKNPEKLEFS